MRLVTPDAMRVMDAEWIPQAYPFAGVPAEARLIYLAAQGVVKQVLALHGETPLGCIHVVFGPGNNGADAVYAGLLFAQRGCRVRYYATYPAEKARTVIRQLVDSGALAEVFWYEDQHPWTQIPSSYFSSTDILIDGILGVGVSGSPRGAVAEAIAFVNRIRTRVKVVSVDIPSGLDAESGAATDVVVEAHQTVCMGFPKTGMITDFALSHSGSVTVHELGMPDAWYEGAVQEVAQVKPSVTGMITEREMRQWISPRRWNANKGNFGHVCVVGGCARYAGAPALAACGALRAGAGLVSAYVPEGIVARVGSFAPEMMVQAVKGETVTAPALQEAMATLGRGGWTGKTVVMGPGLSQQEGVREAVLSVLAMEGLRGIVLDADGLNALGEACACLAQARSPMILTPHPGEAARLLGWDVATVQADRCATIAALVEKTQQTVILKGAGTLVAAPERGIQLLPIVNPGMARGGMGDILAGLVGAYWARGLGAFEAAQVGAWMHGRAGDIAAWRRGVEAMLPSDLLEMLGDAQRL